MARIIPVLVLMVLGLAASPLQAQEKNAYDEFLSNAELARSVRSLATFMLALPNERERMVAQLEKYYWINQPDVELNKAARELEKSRLDGQVDQVEKLVRRHRLRQLRFAGYTTVGSIKDLDLYFGASTTTGPVLIRISTTIGENRIFAFKVFEGWDEARAAAKDIENKPGHTVLSVTYDPDAARDKTPGQGPGKAPDKTPEKPAVKS